MSIYRNLCFFPLDTVNFLKCLAIVSNYFVLTYSSMCDTLLLSTYHAIIHCLLFMVLFDIHLSYEFIANRCDFKVFDYMSYHNIADSMHPYRAFRSRSYSTFTPFSIRTFFLCSRFTLHIMSTNSPSIFSKMNILLACQC